MYKISSVLLLVALSDTMMAFTFVSRANRRTASSISRLFQPSTTLSFTTTSTSEADKAKKLRRSRPQFNTDSLFAKVYPKEWAHYMQQKQDFMDKLEETTSTTKTKFEELVFPNKGKDIIEQPHRMRFAPSPTGSLHVGGARTALYNYLLGKKGQGDDPGSNAGFVLRVEDTDLERSTKESEQSVLEDLQWLGLQWDEGPETIMVESRNFGPYRQSERGEIYSIIAEHLIEQNLAYRCFCTKDELEEMKKKQEEAGIPPRYDGTWRDASEEEVQKKLDEGAEFTVRFKVPASTRVVIDDACRGIVSWDAEQTVGDFILLRSSGVPVYNFCVAVDDAMMGITTVIRAEEHLTNTLRQCLVLDALGVPRPKYAHSSLILGQDKQKLSKRHGATSCTQFRKDGFLPDAMINYLALLGWNDGTGNEIYSRDDLIECFSTDRLVKSPAVFDMEKLKWINSQHIKRMSIEELIPLVIDQFNENNIFTSNPAPTDDFALAESPDLPVNAFAYAAIAIVFERMDTLRDVVTNALQVISYNLPATYQNMEEGEALDMIKNGYFYSVGSELLKTYQDKSLPLPDVAHLLDAFIDPNQDPANKPMLPPEGTAPAESSYSFPNDYKSFMKKLSKDKKIKGKNLFHPIRYALTGEMSGQDVTKQLSLLKMAETYDLLSTSDSTVVTLEERMKRLEAFLESIPEEFRAPAAPVEKPKAQAAAETVSAATVAPTEVNKVQTPAYDGPPFTALDIRVGYIKHAYEHPEADKLYVEEIDLGEDEPRTICSGLRPYIASADDLIGRKVVVLSNLKPRTMLGIASHGMVLCVSDEEKNIVKLLNPPIDATIGQRLGLPASYYATLEDGADLEPFKENKLAKKKIWDKIQPFCNTDDETGTAMFLNYPFLTDGGDRKSVV